MRGPSLEILDAKLGCKFIDSGRHKGRGDIITCADEGIEGTDFLAE